MCGILSLFRRNFRKTRSDRRQRPGGEPQAECPAPLRGGGHRPGPALRPRRPGGRGFSHCRHRRPAAEPCDLPPVPGEGDTCQLRHQPDGLHVFIPGPGPPGNGLRGHLHRRGKSRRRRVSAGFSGGLSAPKPGPRPGYPPQHGAVGPGSAHRPGLSHRRGLRGGGFAHPPGPEPPANLPGRGIRRPDRPRSAGAGSPGGAENLHGQAGGTALPLSGGNLPDPH